MANKLQIKRGTAAGIPQGDLGEPLFTSDTYDLYIGKGGALGNQRFQKYIASGTSSQFLKGDGSLDSTSYEPTLTKGNLTESTSSVLTITGGTGAVIGSGTTIQVKSASTTQNGVVTTGTQSFAGVKTFSDAITLGESSGDNQTLLNLPAGSSLIYREGVGSLYGFNIESPVDNSFYWLNQEGQFYQALYFGDSQGAYNVFGISTSSNSGSTWSPRFVINQNGNIGIGKNDPSVLLDVAGAGTFSGSLTASISALATASNAFVVSDSGTLKSRTAAQVLSDIGAAAALSGTINTIAYWNSATTIGSLATSTYPNLTELSYVKGVTSAIQTQLNAKEPTITAGTSAQYYRGDKTFQTLNTAAVPESGSIYFTEPRVLATVLTGLNLSGGGTIAATDSILTAFGKVQNQISALVGGVFYKGTWNASTNTPTLTSSSGTKGWYYIVSVAGSTNLDGITDWKVGDWAIFNGTTWDKVDNTDAVSSVNGFTGAVNLALGNISDVTLSSPTNTQLLRFNGTSSKWENWTPTYISANQTITLSGDVSGSGTTAITTTIGALKVTNAMLAGSIAASKLIGTDIATVGTITAGIWNGTTIAIANGGTGATTKAGAFDALSPMTTLGDVIYGGATGTGTRLAGNITTTKQYLSQTGNGTASAAPSWATIAGSDITGAALTKTDDTNVTLTLGGTPATALLRAASLTLGWTGQLSVARGGTGASTAVAAFDNLSPLTTLGDTLYHNGTDNVRLAGNTTTTRQFLRQTGTGTASAAPAWDTVTKTDVGLSNVENTALSTWAGSANITTLGTITSGTWNGTTIGVSNGGTGATSFTAGRILFGNGTSAIAGSSSLFWDDTNKYLGIGTSSPTSILQVSGDGTAVNLLRLQHTGTGTNGIFNISVTNTDARLSASYTTTAIPMIFYTGNAERMSISASGVVRINGLTTNGLVYTSGANGTLNAAARNFTINGTAKSFDGSANVSWTAAEIGLTSYLPLSGGTLTGKLTISPTPNSGALIDLIRTSTTYSSAIKFITSTTDNWFLGTNAVGTNLNNIYLYNYGTSSSAIDVNYANNNITFGGTITATNFSGSSSGTNTGDQTTITGNAGTATKLATARDFTINGTAKSFDGSANVSWTAAEIGLTSYLPLTGGTLTGALSGTSATFTLANDASLNLRSGASGSFTYMNIGRTAREGDFAVANANNSFASGSVAGDIVVNAATATNNLILATNSVGRLFISSTGAATFSTGAIGSALSVDINNSGTYGLLGIRRGTQTNASAGINYYTTTVQKWFSGIYENTDNFGFYSVGINGFPLILNYSTGAATFSSSIAATSATFSGLVQGSSDNDKGFQFGTVSRIRQQTASTRIEFVNAAASAFYDIAAKAATFSGNIIQSVGNSTLRLYGQSTVNSSASDTGIYTIGLGDQNSSTRSYITFYQSWNGTYTDYLQKFTITKGGTGTIDWLSINKDGAATFSNVVTAKSFSVVGTNGYSGQFIQQGDIFGTAATNLLIQGGTGNGIGFLTNGGTDFRMFINSSGSIGIGTTSPQSPIDVISPSNGYVSFGRGLSVGQWTGIHFGYREDNTFYRKSAIVFERTGAAAEGNIHFLNNNSADTSSATLANSRMVITSGGNVYIGTTTGDGYKLQIVGGSQAGATFGQTYSGVAAYSQWVNSSGAFVMGLDGAAGATERMRITSGGALVVGNGQSSATPALGLIEGTDGSGTNIAGAELRLQGGQSTGSAAGGVISFYTSLASTSGTATNSAAARMTISGRNVLIGTQTNSTSSPRFYVAPDNANLATIGGFNFSSGSSSDQTNNNSLSSGNYWNGTSFIASATTATIHQHAQGAIYFYTDSGLTAGNAFAPSERMKLTSNGQIEYTALAPKVTSATIAATGTQTPSLNTSDTYIYTGTSASAYTLTIANPTGTPTQGQKMIIRIKDNGTQVMSLSFGTQYRGSTDITLPTATTAGKFLYLGFIYNSTDTKWDLIAKVNNI